MDELGDFFNECTAAITEMVVVVTGALGLVDNTIIDHNPPGQPCERAWGEESDFLSCREEDNWKAYNNVKDIERPEENNDDNGSIFGLFSGGGNDDKSDSEYNYEPASSVEESSGGWSFLGWSGSSGDYSVDTSNYSDSSSDYSSYSDSEGGDGGSDYGGGSDSGGSDGGSDSGGSSDSGGGDGGSWW